MEILIVILGVLAIPILASLLRGWVMSILWGWFFVPLGLHPIGIAWAIGISVTVAMLTVKSSKQDEGIEIQTAMIGMVLIPLMALLIGWIAHSFI